MKDILLKRNKLKENSIKMQGMKFEPSLDFEQGTRIANEQKKIYNKWKFYDRFIKAREEVKCEKN